MIKRIDMRLQDKVKNFKKCNFCYLAQDEVVVLQTTSFYVIPSVGPLSDYHLLIVPFDCVGSFAEFLNAKTASLPELMDLLRRLCRCFGDDGIVIFEHGRIAQSVNHAHLHVIYPWDACKYHKMIGLIEKRFNAPTFYENLTFLPNLAGSEYVLVGAASNETMSICIWNEISPKMQYLRELVAIVEGNRWENYDWNMHPDISKTKKIGHKVKEKLRQVY